MGLVLTAGKYSIIQLQQDLLPKPLIFCNPDKALTANEVSINVEMAKKLSNIKPNRRTLRIVQCFQEILNDLPDHVVIKDFDVMFHPDYAIDVLYIMISMAKIKPFSLIWPGKLEEGKLIYAEEGFRDYKVFDISRYDVTCII